MPSDQNVQLAVRCGECHAKLRVSSKLEGKKGRCPNCRGKFRVPPASVVQAALPDRYMLPIFERHTTLSLDDFVEASGGRPAAPNDTIEINNTRDMFEEPLGGRSLDDLLDDLDVNYGKK